MDSFAHSLNPATTFPNAESLGNDINNTAHQLVNTRHPISLYDDGLLYIWTKMSYLRRSPARPDEVGIPIQCLQTEAMVPPLLPFNSSHSGAAVAQPRATNASRSQVGIACVACRKAGKKCSESRPCGRCIERGEGSTCKDAPSARCKKTKPPTAPGNTDAGALSGQGSHGPGGLSTDQVSPAFQGTGVTAALPAPASDHPYPHSFGATYLPTVHPGPIDATRFSATSSNMGTTNLLDGMRFNSHAVPVYHAEEHWEEVPFEDGGYSSAAGPSGRDF